MQIGLEKKRQAYVLVSLTILLVGIASWEFFGSLTAQTTTSNSRSLGNAKGSAHSRAAGPGTPGSEISEPQLHLAQLGKTETTDYSSGGRNIFSVESEPIAIEEPLAPPRPAEAPPPPPVIDIKYIGYTRNGGEPTLKAVLARKDETLMAASGDIVFHRYRVVSIQPASIKVTDLSHKNTQNLPIVEK